MKNFILTISLILIPSFFFNSCQKDDEIQIKKEKVSGFIQKGPFINGTSILMTELNTALEQTGKIFSTQITNNRGSFEINNVAPSSSFVEFSASGFYFDEVKGDISIAPLNLYALSDITDINTVNVNILTHLEKRRVEYLVKQKNSFTEAKKTAQGEILAIFGFENSEMQESETLDISVNHADNAVLLAISLILQGNRSVGDLTELLAGISTDIAVDGIMDTKSTITDLRNSTLTLNLQNIRENLLSRYQELGVAATIPNFEKYIADFLALTATEPIPVSLPATNITTSGATLNGTVNPNSSSTVVTFEYGLTAEYGSTVTALQSPVSGDTVMSVSADITDLNPATTYHFRVKAENEWGRVYGQDNTFTTTYNGIIGSVTDIDGNSYQTIGIGHQIWMSENLRVTKFADNTNITLIEDSLDWDINLDREMPIPAYCFYNNDKDLAHGALYTWSAAVNGYSNSNENPSGIQGVCPSGWHLPSSEEWQQLFDYVSSLGHERTEGNALKTNDNWLSWANIENCNGTNDFGFNGYPVGIRDDSGHFMEKGYSTGYWSSSVICGSSTDVANSIVLFSEPHIITSCATKKTGLSVRCVKD